MKPLRQQDTTKLDCVYTNNSIFAAQLVLPFKDTSKWRDLLKLKSDAR